MLSRWTSQGDDKPEEVSQGDKEWVDVDDCNADEVSLQDIVSYEVVVLKEANSIVGPGQSGQKPVGAQVWLKALKAS